MARKLNFECEVQVELDGVLNSDIKAKLTEEFLKFILYQRQQIPMTYDSLKADILKEHEKTMKSKRVMMEKKHFVEQVEEVCETFRSVFSEGSVQEVLVLLGSTPVTPKEIYRLSFPFGFYEGRILTFKECTSLLFRKLVTSDFLTDLKPPKSSSKLFVFLLAPRDQPAINESILPKLNYRIPEHRGSRMLIDFVCTAPKASAELSKIEESDINISGVEPLENLSKLCLSDTPLLHCQSMSRFKTPYSCNRTRDVMRLADTPSLILHGTSHWVKTPSNSEWSTFKSGERIRQNSINSLNDAEFEEEGEMIWYQLSTTITGFKEKRNKTKSQSLFMI